MYKLDRVKNSLQQSDKNYNHPKYCKQPNGIGKDPNKSYVWVLENLESWSKKKTKDNITCNGMDWWWFPKQKISDNLIEFTRTAPPPPIMVIVTKKSIVINKSKRKKV